MNCKPTDMAEIVYTEFPENKGAIVEVVALADPSNWHVKSQPEWVCKSAWPIKCKVEGLNVYSVEVDGHEIPDAWLRPIRPDTDQVTTDCDVGVEA